MSPVATFTPDGPKIIGFNPDGEPLVSGNIDLHRRPVVKNPDGSISTVRSKSFNMDGKEVLLPTISDDGRNLSDAEAVDLYRRTGKHLGIFNSPAEATAYAQRLHEDQAAEYATPQPSPRTPAQARAANIQDAKAKESAWDFPLAILKGVAHVAGIPTEIPRTPMEMVTSIPGPNVYAMGQQAYQTVKDLIEAPAAVRAAPTTARKVQAVVARAPLVSPAAVVAEPGITYSEGRAPTHAQNVAAVEGGTELATMGAMTIAGGRASRAASARQANIIAARGVAPAEAAPAVEPSIDAAKPGIAPPSLSEGQVDRLASDARLGNPNKAAVPAKLREAILSGTFRGDVTPENMARYLADHPDVAREVSAGYDTKLAPDEVAAAKGAESAPEQPDAARPPTAAPPQRDNTAAAAPPPDLPPQVLAAASDPRPAPAALPPVESKDYPAALRTRYAGERDVRKAEANTVSNYLKDAVPDKVEREAVLLRRAFKGDQAELDRYADGTHPNLEKPGAREKIGALSDVIEKARNPTPGMLQADAVLDSYFGKTLTEGRDLGFLDSSIDPEQYINHLLQPGDEATASDGGYTYGQGGGIRRTTPHAMKRGYSNVLDAIANGAAPRTLDAAEAVSIYGDRHGHAAAARILENTLKESEIGKVGTKGNVPEGWVELGGENSPWRREVPYHDRTGEESKLAVAHQSLYVPEKIAKALQPITDPNYLLKIPGYRGLQRFQDYIKSANVALAFFHLKAETLNAVANMRRGPVDLAKTFMTPIDSPEFLSVERTAVQHGMQTSIVGQTAEAYRALEPKAMPTKVDAIRNLPVMRQLDAAAQATSRLTFDIAIRKYKVMDFASQDAAWMAAHPEASRVELARARRSIARELNAVYGGLNWEALGVSRTVHGLMRAVMFAPDWAYSNVETVNMAATKGGPGGAAARWYMARAVAGGVAATAAMTYFLTRKKPDEVPGRLKDRLFNVYLGKDAKGNDKFMNVFFAGAPNDAINLLNNVADYGIGKGVGATIANKMAAVPRAGMHVVTNKDFMGRDIVPKDAGAVAGTAISIKNAAADLSPLPFGATNAAQMALDQKREYTPAEYAAAVGMGVRPRHVPEPSTKPERPRNSTLDIIMGASVYKGRKK